MFHLAERKNICRFVLDKEQNNLAGTGHVKVAEKKNKRGRRIQFNYIDVTNLLIFCSRAKVNTHFVLCNTITSKMTYDTATRTLCNRIVPPRRYSTESR